MYQITTFCQQVELLPIDSSRVHSNTNPSATEPQKTDLKAVTVGDRCPLCNAENSLIVGDGGEHHAARLDCSECERFIKWLSKSAFAAIESSAHNLGGSN